MTTDAVKPGRPADEHRSRSAGSGSAPIWSRPTPAAYAPHPGRDLDPVGTGAAELLSKGPEEIQDHLSLVAAIQVQIRALLQTSVEELERAQRLETLAGIFARGPFDPDTPSPGPEGRPGAYLEREIRTLRKMQRMLGEAGGPESVPELQAALGSRSAPPGSEGESQSRWKALIVFHDAATARILRYFLEKENFAVEARATGPGGLEAAVREGPDIILLDILLPGADGLQVIRGLKKNPKTAGIPVIVLSALAQEGDVLKAIDAGAADYFTKPFSPPIVIAKIRRFVEAGRG